MSDHNHSIVYRGTSGMGVEVVALEVVLDLMERGADNVTLEDIYPSPSGDVLKDAEAIGQCIALRDALQRHWKWQHEWRGLEVPPFSVETEKRGDRP